MTERVLVQPLDTTLHVETPEGVRLSLRVAGPISRARAFMVDFLIRFAIYFVFAQILPSLDGLGFALMLLLLFVLEWFYPVIGEVYFHGASPGKHLLGLRVVHENGTPIGLNASMIRNLLRFVDFLPFLYAFGLLSMFVSPSFKRLGDWAAGTVVVYKDETLPVGADARTGAPMNMLAAQSDELEIALNESEQTLLRDLFDRRAELGEPRFAELAAIASVLTDKYPDPVVRLEQIVATLEHGTRHRSQRKIASEVVEPQ